MAKVWLCVVRVLFVVVVGVTFVNSARPDKPHILLVLIDDLGWGNVGFNREIATPEVQTPTIDQLVAEGVRLDRHYVYHMCTPTRTSLQSGRLPVHVNQLLLNPDNPSCGIPRNMTGLAEKMAEGGYKTHMAGKWDAGMATPQHTPLGRGYMSSLAYFEHKNNYWTQKEMQSGCLDLDLNITDLWDTDKPAYGKNGSAYEEDLFLQRVVDVVTSHSPDDPLFLFWAPHLVHCPLQVPENYYNNFTWITDDEMECHEQTPYVFPGGPTNWTCRATYHAMVKYLDDEIGKVVKLFKDKGLWDNTLMIVSSDNGGPLTLPESGANNHPLRGGKYSDFEGGIRVAAFVSGGYLPEKVRGTNQSGIVHVCDWYSTLCSLAGVDPTDKRAEKWGLPPIDSLNMWPLISGANSTSPRTGFPVSNQTIILQNYKLIQNSIDFSGWTGPHFPNSSSPQHDPDIKLHCNTGCLFDVVADPTEHNDLAKTYPDKVKELAKLLAVAKENYYNNHERGTDACPKGVEEECACWMAVNKYGGYYGPYQNVDPNPLEMETSSS